MASRRTGQVIKKGDRKWLVRVPVSPGPDGKRRVQSKIVEGAKRDAEKYLREKLHSRDRGVEATSLTLARYLERWLETIKSTVSPRTLQDYKRFLGNYALPELGTRRVDSLKPLDFQALYDGIAERVSAHAARRTHQCLHAAMEQAIKWRLLDVNPIRGVKVPREPKRESFALSMEEASRFQEAASHDARGLVFIFSLASGMRPGEVLGLQWQDIGFEAHTVTVRRNLVILENGKRWQFGEPKTQQSRRTIKLPATLIRKLASHKAGQAEEKLKLFGAYEDLDLVFAGPLGLPLDRQNLINRSLRSIVAEARLPKSFRWYDLRHSCATLLLAAKENPKVVSERLGHSTVAFTLDRYAHVLPGMQESASAKLGEILFGE